MRVTTKSIAEKCGVSRITVTRALNGQPGIGAEKRALILQTAKQMGYRPDGLARALVRGESRSLGIVVFDLKNGFFAQLVNEFQQWALEKGYVTYVMLTNKNAELERSCIEHLVSRRVDAIALDSAVKKPGYAEYLRSLNLPVLALLNRISDDIPLLGFDDFRAMYDITQYVLSKHYRRILYVCPPLAKAEHSNMDSLIRRKQGFLSAIGDQASPPEIMILGDKQYLQALNDIDLRKGPKTAIVCTSDLFAVQVHSMLGRKGLRAPLDYGLTGFDNIPMLHSFEPQITTVSLRIGALGKGAAEMLIGWLAGEGAPEDTAMPYEILPGQTIL